MMEWNTSTHGQQDPFKWFTESQLHTVFRNGSVPDWFHGIITRKTAEELLMFKPPGYFLIRVSESRIGYTLSYRVDQRCRHFMIEAMEDGQYVIVGENRTHTSLQALVDFYRRTPIMPFNQVLTVACGQSSEHHVNYAQLLVTQRPRSYTTSVLPNNLRQPTPSHPEPVDHTPPPLPHRPNHLMNSEISFPNSQPNRLYPCLEEGVKHSTAPLPTSPVPKVRKKFTADSSPWTSPPEVPLRNRIAQKQDLACTRMASVPKSSSEPPAIERKLCTIVQPLKFQELRPSVATNLKSLKMKFQKKTTNPQENLYEEITKEPDDSSKVVENEYQELTFGGSPYYHTDVRLNDEVLPQEYRSPPPFAPGY